MNIPIFTVLLLFSTLLLQAQNNELFTTYNSSYADRSYDINIIYSDTNNFRLEIDLMTYDSRYSKGGLMLDNNTLVGFIAALDSATSFYNRWEKNARVNGSSRKVKYFQEEKISGYFYGTNKSRINFPLKAKYRFRVLRHKEEIIYVLNISTGNIRSQHGNQCTVRSFSLFFLSEKEIVAFRNLITPEKVKDFIKANN